MSKEHEIPVRVYYEDTDSGGIVYHASYIRFAERGRTELLRNEGYQNSVLSKDVGVLFVVRHMEVDYLKPARLDDYLTVSTSIKWMRKSSLLMYQEIKHDKETLCILKVTVVAVNLQGRPTSIPDDMREMFKKYMIPDQDNKIKD